MTIRQVIIGGGPAATNALETIREFDGGASKISLICDEPAHSRMALPYWLAKKIPREQTYTADDAYYKKYNVDARIGVRATKIDAQGKSLTLSAGGTLAFDNLLIATGSSPLAPAIPGADLPGVQPMWSLAHTEAALKIGDALPKPRVVLVGAGFIGFIVLNAMFKRGWKLAVVEREKQVLPRMLDDGAAGFVESWLASRGVDVHAGTTVQAIRQTGDGSKVVELAGGKTIAADLVILATGIKANLDLVNGRGINTDQGILVNDRMQTNFPFIYAGGDVAQGPVLFNDRPEIHAIQPTAVDHGRVAGANMADHEVRYPGSLLMNVVDVCGLQCCSYGNWNDAGAEVMTIANAGGYVYRKLLWRGDAMVGAIFTGRANDMGMLTDVGMVKGILQTQTPLGPWKNYLADNPFDIRRAYIGAGVAKQLVATTLLGRPTRGRQFQFGGAKPTVPANPAHATFVAAKQ
jgi:NAD(P)H-nitrite reductase large subunit